MTTCQITKTHCESCGSTDAEDIGWDALADNDGYSACCNQLTATSRDCRNHHGDR